MANEPYRLTQTGAEVQADLNDIEALGLATEETAGKMSAADKAKLDNLPSGSELSESLGGKVDKVQGKGLSTNDYTDEDKAKVDNTYVKPQTGIPGTDLAVLTIVGIPESGVYADADFESTVCSYSDFHKAKQGEYAFIKVGTGNSAKYYPILANLSSFFDGIGIVTETGIYTITVSNIFDEQDNVFRSVTTTYLAFPTAQEKAAWNGKYTKPSGGIPASDLAEGVIPDVNGKADKVSNPNSGNFAGLDSNGNITDSGKKASDFATAAQGAKADTAIQDLSPITDLIPAQASDQNQLADKAFVNSSIGTATATFRGTYNLVSDLSLTTAATVSQIATALASEVPTADNNDYCFVQIPTADATPTEIARVDRYKFDGTAWTYEWSLNNSSFTASQWAAINSGITAALVTTFGNKYDKPSGGIPSSDMASAVQTSLGKADTAYQKPINGIPASDMEAGVIPDAVEANPTVPSGTTPSDLTGLKVGNNYYGIPTPTVDNTPTKNSTNLVKSGGVYDAINPSVQSSQPAGGFAPNVVYDLGELTGTVTFALASPSDATVPNAYHWTFETGSTEPTINWPSGIVWPDNVTPTIKAGKHYEVLVRKGYASIIVYTLPSA